MIYINIDANYCDFKINEKFYIYASLVVISKNNQRKTLVSIYNKLYKDDKEKK